MRLVVTSSEDPASMNIRARLLEEEGWTEKGLFAGHPAMMKDQLLMVLVDRIHLDEDGIDERAMAALGVELEVVIFASRHRSEKRIPTLTVHPIGNFASADYGGWPGTLCPAAPGLMTSALRGLASNAAGLQWDVSFETTHHGPSVTTPVFYIEIGSYDELWDRSDAGEAIARTILELREEYYPTTLCVGGGHYAPRFTEVALSRKVSIGHMAPNYALDNLDESMITQMAEKSGGAKMVYFHRKGMPKKAYRELRERFASCGLREIRSDELEPR